MHGLDPFLINFIAALGIGWVGGLAARAVRLPVLIGYIVAGVAFGPHLLGVVQKADQVEPLAELGVAFLLFALGVELSLGELLRVKKVAILGGIAQILLTISLGVLIARSIGWSPTAGLVLGFALALSSTTMLVKILSDRGDIHTQYAKIVMGINITQDLASVVMVGILPVLGDFTFARMDKLGMPFLKTVVFLAVMLVLARFLVPPLLRLVGRIGSKEIFLTTILVLCLLGAGLAARLDLSLALGAFLAGMMISESDYHHETFATVMPLRDIFGLLFFVSLGMSLNPTVLMQHPWEILLILLVLLIGKTTIVLVVVLFARYHLRTALMAALTLAQIGEFSFIIAQLATGLKYLSDEQYAILIAAAIISMLCTPLLAGLGMPFYRLAARVGALQRFLRARGDEYDLARAHQMSQHVVLCGFGRVGRTVGEALRHFSVPLVVIDYDQLEVEALHSEGILALYGDATNQVLLRESGADHAQVAVLCLPDSRSSIITLRHLTRMNPQMTLVTRGFIPSDVVEGYEAGAEEVVEGEFECGLELARHTLLRLGINPSDVQDYVDDLRRQRYHCLLMRETV